MKLKDIIITIGLFVAGTFALITYSHATFATKTGVNSSLNYVERAIKKGFAHQKDFFRQQEKRLDRIEKRLDKIKEEL